MCACLIVELMLPFPLTCTRLLDRKLSFQVPSPESGAITAPFVEELREKRDDFERHATHRLSGRLGPGGGFTWRVTRVHGALDRDLGAGHSSAWSFRCCFGFGPFFRGEQKVLVSTRPVRRTKCFSCFFPVGTMANRKFGTVFRSTRPVRWTK